MGCTLWMQNTEAVLFCCHEFSGSEILWVGYEHTILTMSPLFCFSLFVPFHKLIRVDTVALELALALVLIYISPSTDEISIDNLLCTFLSLLQQISVGRPSKRNGGTFKIIESKKEKDQCVLKLVTQTCHTNAVTFSSDSVDICKSYGFHSHPIS
jgi:hypothetical protein